MYNITLVCTHHSELGRANSHELYKIIDSIKPDVIFEELTEDLFDKFYKQDIVPFELPEITSVKTYLQDHTASHFPVDIKESDKISYDEIKYLLETLSKYGAYSKLEEDHKKFVFQEGYVFLNSKKSEELIEQKKYLERSLLGFHINKDRLLRIHDLFYDEQHNREHGIIKNVYNFSEKIEYRQALLLLGSGHRKTIFEKVKKNEFKSRIRLNWALYGN